MSFQPFFEALETRLTSKQFDQAFKKSRTIEPDEMEKIFEVPASFFLWARVGMPFATLENFRDEPHKLLLIDSIRTNRPFGRKVTIKRNLTLLHSPLVPRPLPVIPLVDLVHLNLCPYNQKQLSRLKLGLPPRSFSCFFWQFNPAWLSQVSWETLESLSIKDSLSSEIFDITFLPELWGKTNTLRRLSMENLSFAEPALSTFSENTSLASSLMHLNLSHTNFPFPLVERWFSLSSLTSLSLSHYRGWNLDMVESIANLAQLRELDLTETALPQRYLERMAAHRSFRVLRLGRNELEDLSFLDLTQIVALDLSYQKGDALSRWRPDLLPSLRRLNLAGNRLTSPMLELLEACPNLTDLDLSDNKLKNVDFLRHTPILRILQAQSNSIHSPEGLRHVPHLRNLDLSYNWFSSDAFRAMPTLEKLEKFYCNKGRPLGNSGVDVISKHFPQLYRLAMESHNIDYDGLLPLSKTTKLAHVYLAENKIGDDGLCFLGRQPAIRCIDVRNNGITDSGLERLSESYKTALDGLWLGENRITREGVGCLAKIPTLTWLSLPRLHGGIQELGFSKKCQLF